MNAQIIEDILNQAKVDKNGRIMNKGRLNDMLHSEHLKAVKNCSIPAVVGQSEQLIAFQNFLILDGQIDLEPDEVKRNAEIFLGD